MILFVQKLSENATVPCKGSQLAAGYDLSSAEDAVVPPRGQVLVKTDLAIAFPEGCYGRVAPRSGLAVKKCINVGAGVIDADYRGNVSILLMNHSDEEFQVKKGDRVAQLILEMVADATVTEVSELPMTSRGSSGFGSTGVSNPLSSSTPVSEQPFELKRCRIMRTVLHSPMLEGLDQNQRKKLKLFVSILDYERLDLLEQVLLHLSDHEDRNLAVQELSEWIDVLSTKA